MNNRLVVILGALAVIVAGSIAWYSSMHHAPAAEVSRPAPAAAPPMARTEPAAPASAPDAAAAPAATAPRTRRNAAPKDAAPAEPEPAAAMGTLHITSDVAGAQVFIDRNYIGVAPVTSPEMALGSHRINVVAQGFDSIAENVDVEAGARDLQFNFKEVRLDASVDVVHKHRLGSCRGRLVATPSGLRYETNDKDDRFTLPLAEIEQFDVDYLAKTLKVKGTKGKRYEFSDPTAANGDRLFVFHRDVDKARQRIKQGS
jgi:PEGA domain-containing protein